MNRLIYPIVLTILLCLTACVKPHGSSQIKPISPPVGDPNLPRKADSLQPTLQWEPPPAPGTTYDLVIFEGIKTTSFWKGTRRSIGRKVYYREGITTSSHQVEETLKPNTEYYWSVRVHRGDLVSPWAKYDYKALTPLYYKEGYALPFLFKTPKE